MGSDKSLGLRNKRRSHRSNDSVVLVKTSSAVLIKAHVDAAAMASSYQNHRLN